MPVVDPDKVADIIRAVAADKIEPRFQKLEAHEIRSKSTPTDLATIADDEAEFELTRILKDLLPGSQVVGEEAVSSGDISRDILKSDDYVWVIDPVDGTSNFAHGKPVFGTMVALVKNGERIMSWIYQVPRQRMIYAGKGDGVHDNGAPFKLAERPEGVVDFAAYKALVSRKFIPPHMRPFVDEQAKSMQKIATYMCCAWDYVSLLEGNELFSVYKRIEPWDHLAGVLLLEEAGFTVRKWDGSAYHSADIDGGLVNAPNQEIWEKAHRMFVTEPMRMAGMSKI